MRTEYVKNTKKQLSLEWVYKKNPKQIRNAVLINLNYFLVHFCSVLNHWVFFLNLEVFVPSCSDLLFGKCVLPFLLPCQDFWKRTCFVFLNTKRFWGKGVIRYWGGKRWGADCCVCIDRITVSIIMQPPAHFCSWSHGPTLWVSRLLFVY